MTSFFVKKQICNSGREGAKVVQLGRKLEVKEGNG